LRVPGRSSDRRHQSNQRQCNSSHRIYTN
jgi:hypothetical protein